MIGALGIKAILGLAGAVAVASVLAYTIHTFKSAGSMETALKVSRATIEAQHAAKAATEAHVRDLSQRNARLSDEAERRSRALSAALASIPATKATSTCPTNCVLQPLD